MMSVKTEIDVDAPLDAAFAFFAERFDAWWPRGHKIGGADLEEAIIEPRQGGRWYERDVDGSECVWGEVLAWEPPHRLVLSWRIGSDWQLHDDEESEIHVTFAPRGAHTHVELEHRHLERHAGGEKIRESVSQEGGWPGLLVRYRDALVSRSSAAELMQ
jgi:uncharacterized protein YndB with AHSA1/START domain